MTPWFLVWGARYLALLTRIRKKKGEAMGDLEKKKKQKKTRIPAIVSLKCSNWSPRRVKNTDVELKKERSQLERNTENTGVKVTGSK